MDNSIKLNRSLYSLYHPEACNEFTGPNSATLHLEATQLLSKKYRSGGEPFATLCPIWPARDLNIRAPTPETNAIPLNQLADHCCKFVLEVANISWIWTRLKIAWFRILAECCFTRLFFVIYPFRKKIFISNQLHFESKFNTNKSWKFEFAKVTRSLRAFEVFQSQFQKSEHFLANS